MAKRKLKRARNRRNPTPSRLDRLDRLTKQIMELDDRLEKLEKLSQEQGWDVGSVARIRDVAMPKRLWSSPKRRRG